MDGLKISNENNNKKPFSLMDSSSLPLAPSSFQVWKKPFFMNYHNGASSSGTKPYYPLLQSDHSPMVNEDDDDDHNNNNKTTSNQNPSPPSDDDHKMMIPSGHTDARWTRKAEHDMDPRKLKRIKSNRASAQKYRTKKLLYVTEMEKQAKSLETQIAFITPQVSLFKNKQEFLQVEQKCLKQRMITYNNNSIVINAEIAANQAEVARLRQLHMSQQHQKMQPQMVNANTKRLGSKK